MSEYIQTTFKPEWLGYWMQVALLRNATPEELMLEGIDLSP